jgi:hypothetical protein
VIRWLVETFGRGDRQQATSNVYWGLWIGVMFLVPEVLAALHVIPMYTLSRTSWHDQEAYPVLRTLIAGFLMGLAVHIRFATPLGTSVLGGMVIALAMHLCWHAI